jgi:dolichyl-phosphate-mannose--protein O-mannosyl transferase
MVLAVTYLLRDLSEATIVLRDRETGEVAMNPETGGLAVSHHHPYLPFVVAYLALALALTVWFWPVLTAGQVSDSHWKTIVWFRGWI